MICWNLAVPGRRPALASKALCLNHQSASRLLAMQELIHSAGAVDHAIFDLPMG